MRMSSSMAGIRLCKCFYGTRDFTCERRIIKEKLNRIFLPMPRFLQLLKIWLPLAFASACIVLLITIGFQQTYRANANDPQIQMAEDAATLLTAGHGPETVIPTNQIDFGKSIAPFLITTDEDGNVLASSGSLDGALIIPPKGTLDATKANKGKGGIDGENRFT